MKRDAPGEQDAAAIPVFRVLQAHRGHRDRKVQQVPKVQQVLKARKVLKVRKVPRVQKALKVQQVLKVQKVLKARKVLKVPWERRPWLRLGQRQHFRQGNLPA